ncbi:MAG: cadmium-translocating P-type ATPase [Candidatus Thorarchaeota archaeon]|nr:cadmium-translocating P-type ATPase [Candidatus Thorarchaeota archaeon]
MFLETSTSSEVCVHCAGHEEEDLHSSLHVKYALSAASGATLLFAIIFEFLVPFDLLSYALSILTMAIAGRWIIPRGIRGAAKLHLDINFLMTAAGIGALLIGEPTEGAAAIFLFFVANVLEDKAGDQVRNDIQALMELSPHAVSVTRNGVLVEVPVEDVKQGEMIVVRPGDRIGLDGLVKTGVSLVNQSTITGESVPVSKKPGEEVYAGTINLDGYLEIEVSHESDNTVFSRIVKLVEDARKKKSRTERVVGRFSHIYTPLVVIGAFLAVAVSILLQVPVHAAVYRGLTLLVISCPCAFALSIPIAMVSSITGSARSGILVKGGEYIEALGDAKTVAFDKTGTLTTGQLHLLEICPVSGTEEKDVLLYAASLESLSEHPISRAIVEAINGEGIPLLEISDFQAFPGKGIAGTSHDSKLVIGNQSFLIENFVEPYDVCPKSGGTLVYVAKGGHHIGTLVLGDTIRPGVPDVIGQLKDMGIRTVMLTGDNEYAAQAVANELELDEYRANLLPHEKVEAIEDLSKHGTTVMVGEGVNDAPALAASDVSIVMGVAGSDIALEAADVALMKDDLGRIPSLISLARRTMRVIRQNIGISIGLKLLIASLAFFGLVSLWVAVGVGDMGVSLLVILNAMLLVRKL